MFSSATDYRSRLILTFILTIVVGLVAVDVTNDWREGASFEHLLAEGFIGILSLAGVAFLWLERTYLRKSVRELRYQLASTEAEARKWKAEHSELLKGLSHAIDTQFTQWSFTQSEKDIAHLLLKGLSLKEIAELRQTNERTVRQQTVGIYSKSKLAGRAELAAFFLEDLFSPSLRE